MCGESWLAIKESLIHHPSSQGWASGVHFYFLFYFILCFLVLSGCMSMDRGGIYFFRYFLTALFLPELCVCGK